MSGITVALDKQAANALFRDAEAALKTQSKTGHSSHGGFNCDWTIDASFTGGTIDLIDPDIIHVADCRLQYSLGMTFKLDVKRIIERIPLVHYSGKSLILTVPITASGALPFSADFGLTPHLDGDIWLIDLKISSTPKIDLGSVAVKIVGEIAKEAPKAILKQAPFLGSLAGAVMAVTSSVLGILTIAEILGILNVVINPFLSGLTFSVYKQPKVFQVLPNESAINPAVNVSLDFIGTDILITDKSELVLTADISA